MPQSKHGPNNNREKGHKYAAQWSNSNSSRSIINNEREREKEVPLMRYKYADPNRNPTKD